MKDTWFYKLLRPLKFFRTNKFRLELLKIEPDKRVPVLGKVSLVEIKEMEARLKSRPDFLNEWKATGKRKGNPVLFIGPHKSGQILNAGLLGNFSGKEVYRIDLSGIASKYIGETEKNLSKIFEKAAGRDWILFFDEADALFGKRTNVKDAHDKYANQELNYLLQRIENYPGPTIVSTAKTGVDNDFLNRFRLTLQFPLRKKEEENSR